MEEINSRSRLALKPSESMQQLQKAVYASDARLRIRADQHVRGRLILSGIFIPPFLAYMLYHTFAPEGAMQNFRASNGAYLYWFQNFMGNTKTYQQVYRPQFYLKDDTLPLYMYTKKIAALRKSDGEVAEDVHHPTSWM